MVSPFKTAAKIARHACFVGLAALASGSLALDAAAQPAPITFAGAGPSAPAPVSLSPVPAASLGASSLSTGLAGGGEGSYGYGAQAASRQGAVIDVRRGASRQQAALPSVAPEMQSPAAPVAGEGATPWLEQERVGPPYEANGRWYVPTPEPGYAQVGQASWYGPQFHGQSTSSGEAFDQEALTAAHPTLPIPSLVQVTNLENGREVIVRVNDRGPFVGERLIDVSRRTAEVLGFEANGQARVHVRYLGPAPRRVGANGEDAPAARRMAAADMGQGGQTTDGPTPLLPAESAASVLASDQTVMPPSYQRAPAPVAAAEGAFMVQVGAFSNIDNARAVQAEVQGIGPVSIDTRQTASGELFRVRLGPWNSRAEAEAARRALADLGYGQSVLAAR